MESTRTKILDILRRRREATVEDLSRALELAPATVRRHLDILQRDGQVKVRPVRRETGRPHYAFSITEAGEAVFPQHYVRITNRLIDEIMALAPEDTSGRSGRELAGIIFERMAERLAASYSGRIAGSSLGERLQQAAELLKNEGIVLDIQPDGDGFLVSGRGCPCSRLADARAEPCDHDARLLGRLIGTEVTPEPDGSAAGERVYRVREGAVSRL